MFFLLNTIGYTASYLTLMMEKPVVRNIISEKPLIND